MHLRRSSPTAARAPAVLGPLVAALLAIACLSSCGGGGGRGPTAGTGQTRILVLGDEWAAWVSDRLGARFLEEGHDPRQIAFSALAGTADDLRDPAILSQVDLLLRTRPETHTVHLTVGLMDLLREWHTGLSTAESLALLDRVRDAVVEIVQHLLDFRDGLHVVIGGYDYLNFEETVRADPTTLGARLWKEMGSPPPIVVNKLLGEFEERMAELAAHERVSHVWNLGVMQIIFGYPSRNIPPRHPSLPREDLPSPPEAMAGNGTDPLLVNVEGFDELAWRCFEGFYRERLVGGR